MPAPPTFRPCTLSALYLHPVKSCAGIAVAERELLDTGLDLDREWMVVDPRGRMLTQRRWPRLALVRPALHGSSELVLRAPGMLALHLRVDTVEDATEATVWDDTVPAFGMGPLAAQWFTDFLGTPARLVRFDPDVLRACDPRWSAGHAATVAFADGFPLLVAGQASLDELNARLAEPVTMARFRPNVVVDGLAPFEEDRIERIEVLDGEDEAPSPAADDGRADGHGAAAVLALVKPCVRCTIPDVDPVTAAVGTEPGATLATFRADPRMDGGITFGMNAVVARGAGARLRVGQRLRAWLR